MSNPVETSSTRPAPLTTLPVDSARFSIQQLQAWALMPIRFIRLSPGLAFQLSKYLFSEVFTKPWIVVALVFHCLLLIVPVWEAKTSETIIEEVEDPSEEKVESIDVSELSELVGAVAEPTLPSPIAAAQVAPPPPAAGQVVITAPTEEPPIETIDPVEEVPLNEVLSEPPLTEAPPVPPAFNVADVRNRVIGRITSRAGETTPPSPLLLRRAQRLSFFQVDDIESPVVAGITNMEVFPDQRAEDLFPKIQTDFEADGLSMSDAGVYGDNSLYKIIDVNSGNEAGYLSVIIGQGGTSTILAFWQANPNQL